MLSKISSETLSTSKHMLPVSEPEKLVCSITLPGLYILILKQIQSLGTL